MRIKQKAFDLIYYSAIILAAILFLYVGNIIAVKGLAVFDNGGEIKTVGAKVAEIIKISQSSDDPEWDYGFDDKDITFRAAVKKGLKEEYITATQNISSHYFGIFKEVEEGDKVILSSFSDGGEWYFIDYIRIDKIMFLGAVFIVLLLFFGRVKGLNAILSLCLTCTAIFAVFIPSLLSGKNIYITSVIVCVYSVVITLFIVNGVNRKSLAAVAGCFGGIIVICALTLFMGKVLGLTGLINEESMYLEYLPTERPIDLKAVIFAGIVIGAVGAVMDVAMSISSALWEIKIQAQNSTFASIFKSGMNIGKDVMGTMTNTLVLAYIGSSLPVILLLFVYANSLMELMNRELVIVELLQAVVGSLGILLTMPLTALVCAVLYSRKRKHEDEHDDKDKNSRNEIDEKELARFKF